MKSEFKFAMSYSALICGMSILFSNWTENVTGMRTYLYRQGSLPDTESWHSRLCGRGPTLAFRGGTVTAASATEKRIEGPTSSRYNSRASHAVASSACENTRDSSRSDGSRSRSTKGVR